MKQPIGLDAASPLTPLAQSRQRGFPGTAVSCGRPPLFIAPRYLADLIVARRSSSYPNKRIPAAPVRPPVLWLATSARQAYVGAFNLNFTDWPRSGTAEWQSGGSSGMVIMCSPRPQGFYSVTIFDLALLTRAGTPVPAVTTSSLAMARWMANVVSVTSTSS